MAKELIDVRLWELIEPLLPKCTPRNRQYAGRRSLPDRAVVTRIVFVLRSGIPRNMLPCVLNSRAIVSNDSIAVARLV